MKFDSARVASPLVRRALLTATAVRYSMALRFLAALMLLVLAFVSLRAEAQGTAGNPAIAITATPDPVRPGELVQYVITATNRSAIGHSFRVSAQVPNHTTVAAGAIANPPSISQGGGCGGGVSTCPAGSTISWDFGNNPIAPGQSVTVQFAALVGTTNPPPNGTIIRSTASVVSSGIDSATAGVDVVVSSAGLSLGMVNASSPVAPGATLSYTLEFGNPGAVSAPAATLAMALPAGTSFVSATGGGALVGSTVQWNVGALPSGGTGQQQLVVQVDPAAANGSVVSAAADLRDTGTGASLARANAAAVVLTNAGSQVLITATPDPVRPGELVQYVITATNRSAIGHSFRVSAQVPNHTTVALLRLVLEHVDHVGGGELADALHLRERLVDRHGTDRHRRRRDERATDAVDVAASGEVHHRVCPVFQGDGELPLLFLDLARDRARADVRVHLARERDADAHRLEVRVLDVRGDDEATARDLAANQLGFDLLAKGDELHLFGGHALTRVVHLRDTGTAPLRNPLGAHGRDL